MNNFTMTLDARRYDTATKTGRLELIGVAERRLWHIANMRGSIDWIVFYAIDRQKFTAEFLSSSETDKKVVVRFKA